MMRRLLGLLLLVLALAACGGEPTPREVTLLTHESFEMSEAVIEAFESQSDATLTIVRLDDAGVLVNQAILSKNNPLGDVIFGVDNTFLGRALDEAIFQPYASPAAESLVAGIEVDPEYRVTPIDFGDVCLNYDVGYFEAAGLAPPSGLESLADPAYRGQTVVENPATSSPGLAFLLATVARFGDGWEEYWSTLRDNEVFVTAGWSEAYFDHFTAGGGEGSYPIVVSYASSPPFTEGATASVTADQSCFRQIEYAGLLVNAPNPELGQQLIDFMLSRDFQDALSEQMFVFPVVEGATVSEAFEQWATIPAQPATVEPATIEAERDRLIARWTEIMLR